MKPQLLQTTSQCVSLCLLLINVTLTQGLDPVSKVVSLAHVCVRLPLPRPVLKVIMAGWPRPAQFLAAISTSYRLSGCSLASVSLWSEPEIRLEVHSPWVSPSLGRGGEERREERGGGGERRGEKERKGGERIGEGRGEERGEERGEKRGERGEERGKDLQLSSQDRCVSLCVSQIRFGCS